MLNTVKRITNASGEESHVYRFPADEYMGVAVAYYPRQRAHCNPVPIFTWRRLKRLFSLSWSQPPWPQIGHQCMELLTSLYVQPAPGTVTQCRGGRVDGPPVFHMKGSALSAPRQACLIVCVVRKIPRVWDLAYLTWLLWQQQSPWALTIIAWCDSRSGLGVLSEQWQEKNLLENENA